jgi:hypothetical protein
VSKQSHQKVVVVHRKRKFNEISGNSEIMLQNRSQAISNHNQSVMMVGAGEAQHESKRNSAMTVFAA